jgi:hypothetical protein
MNKIIANISFCLLLLAGITSSAYAQNNSVELGLGGLAVGSLNLRYERLITPKSSIQLTVSPLIPRKLNPDNVQEINDATFDDGKITGFTVIPEYRFYLGQGEGMRGFYVGPYLRYTNYGFKVEGTIDTEPGNASVRLSSIGAGIQIGAQWIIGEHFTIDWHIIGIGGDGYNLKLRMEADDVNYDIQGFYDDFIAEWADIDEEIIVNLENFVSDKEFNSFTIRVPFASIGFRAGISLGYAF